MSFYHSAFPINSEGTMVNKAVYLIAASILLLCSGGNALAYSVTETEPNNVMSQANSFAAVPGDNNLAVTGSVSASYTAACSVACEALLNGDDDWFKTSGWAGGAGFALNFSPTPAAHTVPPDATLTLEWMDSSSNVLGSQAVNITGGPVNLNGFMPTDGVLYIALLNLHSDSLSSYISSEPAGTSSSFSSPYTLSLDVAPVPEPAALWLFGSGMLGLIGIARRKQKQH